MSNISKVRTRTRSVKNTEQPHASANDNRRISVEYIATDLLILPKRQLKKHGRQKIELLAASILENGLLRPILVDGGLRIVAGSAVWMAAKHLGMAEVPIVQVSHLSEEQLRIYAIADNQMANSSPWDLEMLSAEFTELCALNLTLPEGLNLELSGFATSEIDDLIIVASTAEPQTSEELPTGPTVCRAGDLWLLGQHRLICGDALKAETYPPLMQGELAQMVVDDPPYNVAINGHVAAKGRFEEFAHASGEMSASEFTSFLATVFGHAASHSVDGSIHYHFMDWRHMREIQDAGDTVYDEFKNLIVWDKGRGGQGAFYRSQHELVFVFKKGKAAHINNFSLGETGRYRTNVQAYPPPSNFARARNPGQGGHPTIKNVTMIADFMRDCSKPGGVVLDCFGGSGTTLLAAERTGRSARLVEIEPSYCDLAIRLWQEETGLEAILAETGESFALLTKARGASLDAEENGNAA